MATQAMERKKQENRGSTWQNNYDREEEKKEQKTLEEFMGEKK